MNSVLCRHTAGEITPIPKNREFHHEPRRHCTFCEHGDDVAEEGTYDAIEAKDQEDEAETVPYGRRDGEQAGGDGADDEDEERVEGKMGEPEGERADAVGVLHRSDV
jgi:hypothetical protein